MKNRIFTLLVCLMLCLSALLALTSCVGKRGGQNIAKISVEEFGDIVVELNPKAAPITVANFKELAGSGFYDGLTFHRIVKNFMIQGGDPKGDGTGGSDKKIKGEFALNGYNNPISHVRGVISMARAGYSYDSASSQFFICHADSTFLDGGYAAFGRVIAGMDVVDAIANVQVYGESPLERVVIKSITLYDTAKDAGVK